MKKTTFLHGEEAHEVTLETRGNRTIVRSPAGELSLTYARPHPHEVLLETGGRRVRAFVAGNRDEVYVHLDGTTWSFKVVDPDETQDAHGLGGEVQTEVVAQMPGVVARVHVQEGQRVEKGQALLVLESMKMENTEVARHPAVVRRVNVRERQQVEAGAVLVELHPLAATGESPLPTAPGRADAGEGTEGQ